MNVKSLKIPEVLLITPDIHNDERGYFFEFFNENKFNECTGLSEKFVQDNISFSKRGVLRGLHFQENPMEQGKLVGVISGEVFDVAVDLRECSPTFLRWHAEVLSESNHKTFVIPEGFAHGFQTLTENCELLYLHTAAYEPKAEAGLNALDDQLSVEWPLSITERSLRDQQHAMLAPDFSGLSV